MQTLVHSKQFCATRTTEVNLFWGLAFHFCTTIDTRKGIPSNRNS